MGNINLSEESTLKKSFPVKYGKKEKAPFWRRIPIILAYLILTAWAIWSILPLVWMISTSFRTATAMVEIPPQWIPKPATLDNYHRLFVQAPLMRWLFNSTIIAVIHTACNLFFCSLAGYAFAKKHFPGRDGIFWLLLSTMMIPSIVLLAPLFLLVARMGLVDTYAGLILPGVVSVFGIFLMKQFIGTLPNALIDAARIDGCSEFGIYWRIILPLCKPGLAVLGIFNFMGSWNDFLWPLLVTQSSQMRTLAVGLASLQQEALTDYGLLMAGSVFAAIPMVIAFLLFQKHFLTGITIGAIKG